MTPHLAVLHVDSIPPEYFSDFTDAVRAEGLALAVESRPSNTPYAGIEWLMPTAIAAYLARPYFESFLKEMGKDHYGLVKEGLKKLYARVASSEAPKVTQISTAGKVNKHQPYSLFFSVVAAGPQGSFFKLLIPRPIEEQEYEVAITAFLDFALQVNLGKLDQQAAIEFKEATPTGRTTLVVYDMTARRIKPVNPLAERRADT